MAERKVKCIRCGKWFKAADYRHTLCSSCTAAERARRAPASPESRRLAPPVLPGSPPAVTGLPHRTEEPAARPIVPAPAPAAAASNGTGAGTSEPTPSAAPKGEAAGAARRPPELTPAQRAAVEARYLELAAPREYDGIRGQIAGELHLPRALVKRAVNVLRQRLGRPSWWDMQQSAIPSDVLDAVKPRYLALLAEPALPPVGVHRQLAEELGLSGLQVYRAIGRVRADLGLPKFNERPEEAAEIPETQEAQAQAS